MKIKIIKPSVGLHGGSSFRELLDMWGEFGLCQVMPGFVPPLPWKREETQLIHARCWIHEVGKILLYDNDILDKLHEDLVWELALFGNEINIGPKSVPWTFWPYRPKAVFKHLESGRKNYDDRKHESVFIGTYTTPKRPLNYHSAIQNYWMGHESSRLLSQQDYLEVLSQHKFGLCLPGVGPKCLRDIELIALGIVPIVTPGVCTNYYNKLQKDKHFLYANNPTEVRAAIENCTRKKWEYLSNNCIKWYEKNCSPIGSFNLTMEIIESHGEI